MPSSRHKFATAVTCIDGRVQQPIVDWVKLNMNVHYVDLITEPGPDLRLSEGPSLVVEEMIRKVSFSIQYHESNVVAVSGHHDCAANHATRDEHIEQILDGVRVVLSHQPNVRVLGLWLNEWNSVELVWDTQQQSTARGLL
jgi:carbonic anhydrase